MSRRSDLGRLRGIYVTAEEVEAHIANGWTVADDLADGSAGDGVVLLAPPDEQEEMAA